MNKTHLSRRASRYAATLAAAGLITAPLLLATTGSAAGDQETPAERCQRQTAEYNAGMEAAWRAAHPGEEPSGTEWPPFICHDIPTPSVSTLPHLPPGLPTGDGNGNGNGTGSGTGDGNTGGTEPAPERTHRYEGFDRPDSQYQQDMALGAPRTGLAERMNTDEPTDTTRPSSGDTARSNAREVVPWDTTITDDNGDSRDVRVVDTPDGPAVITDDGTATGEVLTTDTDSGSTSVTRQDGLEGRQLAVPTNTEDSRVDREAADSTGAAPTSAAMPAPGVADTASEASGGAGDDAAGLPVGPLGAGGALAGAAGAILADRRRRDGVHRGDINWGNGREQSLLLIEGPDSPREHRFAMDVPAGGQMVNNADGSVDIVDADGNVVEHVKAPWAYDALGRPVETHFEIDNETGELVQIVDPERTTPLPILADPDKEKTAGESEDGSALRGASAGAQAGAAIAGQQNGQRRQDNNDFSRAANGNQNPADTGQETENDPTSVGIVDTTGRSDGDTWTEDLGNGETATYTIPDGTGGQTVDAHIEREDGTFTDTRSVKNDVGGWDAWSNNDDGTSAYGQSNQDDGTHYSEHYDTAPTPQATVEPDVTSQANADNSQGTVLANNPDGTQSYGDYQRTGDNQYDMQVQNPDDSVSDIQSTQRDDAGVSTQVDDQDGSRVSTDGENVVPLDDAGNDISQDQDLDPNTGKFYNSETGEWVNGAVVDGVDTPVYRLDDGNLVWGMNNDNGGTDWVMVKPSGEAAVVRRLEWNPDGSPVVTGHDPFTGDAIEEVSADGTDGPSEVAKLSANAISGAMIDGTAEGIAGPGGATTILGKTGENLARGASSAAFGTVLGTAMDMNEGMGAAEAITTNAAGGAAGWVAGAATGAALGTLIPVPGVGTALGFATGAVVSYLTTDYLQGKLDD